jgi:hypothetical protein
MTDKSCKICFGLGWVCENHPDKVWDRDIGCECGAGAPCECNAAGGIDQPDTSAILVQEHFRTKH